MAIYVNKNNGFQQSEPLTRECPRCGAVSQLLPIAAPSFAQLSETHPRHAGLVFRCAACNEPRFMRAVIRTFGSEQVELAPHLAEVERPRERFQYHYLPDSLEALLRETLECYSIGAVNAFATMARRLTRSALRELDSGAMTRWQDTAIDVLRTCEVDVVTAEIVESVLFGDDELPRISADQAAVLVEIVKDLFYQSYVRTAKLRAALKMRRFFASEGEATKTDGKSISLDRDGWRELA